MQDTLTDMQKNVDANDSAKVSKNAEDLETNWQQFEDDIKKNQADLYGKVEDPLGAIQTGAKQDPLDQATLKEQITKLNDVLKEIK
jgi:iron uptake system EfeUOB component EfeO/EfeM